MENKYMSVTVNTSDVNDIQQHFNCFHEVVDFKIDESTALDDREKLVVGYASANTIKINSNIPLRVTEKVGTNNYKTLSEGTDVSLNISNLPAGYKDLYLFPTTNGVYDIYIADKDKIVTLSLYNHKLQQPIVFGYMPMLQRLTLDNTNIPIDVSELSELPSLISLSWWGGMPVGNINDLPDNAYEVLSIQCGKLSDGVVSNVSGNMERFANTTSIAYMNFISSDVEGNIESLHKLTNLSTLRVQGSAKIKGNLCVLCKSYLDKGRTRSLSFSGPLSNCDINGDPTITANVTFPNGTIEIVSGYNHKISETESVWISVYKYVFSNNIWTKYTKINNELVRTHVYNGTEWVIVNN